MIIKVFKKALKLVTAPLRKILGWLFKMPDPQDPAAVLIEKQGSDHPIPVVYGTRKLGVIKVHKYVTDLPGGADNELLHLICVLCEGEIDAIEEVFFDGKSENDAQWRKDKNNANGPKWFTVHRYLGAANQDPSWPAVAAIPNWGLDHKLSGLAYLYVVLQMDKDQSIWRGEPEITARVRGRKIYDPRSNTTAYSENPAIQLLDYLQNTVYGKGISGGRLILPSFIAAASVADETVNSIVIQNGTPTAFSHKRFSSNTYVDTGTSVFNNVQQMLSAMRGSLPIGSGSLRLQIENEASPVFYFSHGRSEQINHATITGKIKSSGGNKKDRFNRVVVRFPNAALDFERDEVFYPDSEDPLFTEWLAEDNGVLLEQNFEFNTITNKAEALQMARIIALRSRFQLQCSFPASPAAIVVEPGDVVGITDDTRGWDAKPFRVQQVKLKDDGDVELEFIEHQNAIYPWSGTTYEERTGGTNLGDPTNIPAPTGLSIEPDLTLASGGRLTWSMANNAFVRRFRVQIANAEGVFFSEESIARAIVLPLLDAGEYTISVFALSTLATLSPPAVINFNLVTPLPPTEIQFSLGNFEIEARPVLAGAGLGTQFEFAIGDTSLVRGRGISMVFAGLKHGTGYTVFARTINPLGISSWIARSATTTSDSSDLLDLLGEDIADSIFDDVVAEIGDQLEDLIGGVEFDDPRDLIVEGVNDAFEDADLSKAVVKETMERRTAEQVIAAELTQLTASVQTETEERTAQFQQLTTAVVTEQEVRAQQVTVLTASIDTEMQQRVAQISSVNQAIVNESTIRAQQVDTLSATLTNQGNAIAANITKIDEVEVSLDGTATALSVVQGQVNNATTGLSASYSLAQSAKTDAAGNATAISGMRVAVAGTNSQAQAELILTATVEKAGEAHARAFFGVTSVSGGVARVNGIVVDGATNTLEFRADTMRLTNTAGVVQMYYDTDTARWVFNGDLIAANFKTANSGYRAEMGTGTYPLWYGTGTKNLANALFAVDNVGNVTLRNANVQGRVVTSEGTGIRVDVGNDGTYLLWAGSGAKTDVNGIFWIKANGQGFIKGDFFAGQIIESQFGTASSSNINSLTATASTHNSAGKAVEVTGNTNLRFNMAGDHSSSTFQIQGQLRRGGTALLTVVAPGTAQYDSEQNTTFFFASLNINAIDQLATPGDRIYSFVHTTLGAPIGTLTSVLNNMTVKTFENKLAS